MSYTPKAPPSASLSDCLSKNPEHYTTLEPLTEQLHQSILTYTYWRQFPFLFFLMQSERLQCNTSSEHTILSLQELTWFVHILLTSSKAEIYILRLPHFTPFFVHFSKIRDAHTSKWLHNLWSQIYQRPYSIFGRHNRK